MNAQRSIFYYQPKDMPYKNIKMIFNVVSVWNAHTLTYTMLKRSYFPSHLGALLIRSFQSIFAMGRKIVLQKNLDRSNS